MPTWLRRTLIVLGALVAVIVLLAALGFGYESYSRSSALASATPPGTLVDVGGHRLHILCSGPQETGQPTIVLESGVGGWSLQWQAAQEQIAAFARVCAYDRAGMGWSEAGPAPRDGRQVATELHTLLANAGESGPYVLVGASRGGQYARIFSGLFSDDVAGLVLVDAEPEDIRQQSSFAASAAAQNQSAYSTMSLAARLGVFRLLGAYQPGADAGSIPTMPCLPAAVNYLPAELHTQYLAAEGQPSCFDTVMAEETASAAREAQVRELPVADDLPVIVMTHGEAELPPSAGAIVGAAEYEETWQRLQRELADGLPNATFVVAESSGHDIMVDQPELVAESVRQVLAAAGQ